MLILATLSTTLILKSLLSYENISKIINNTTKLTIDDSLFNQAIKENELDTELNDYIDQKQLNIILQEYVEELITYKLGEGDAPKLNSPEVNKLIDESISKYEAKTNKKVDKSKIIESLNNADEEIASNQQLPPGVSKDELKKTAKIYKLIINKTITIVLIIVLIILISLLFLINKNTLENVRYLITSFLMNGVCILVIPFILKSIFNQKSVTFIFKPFVEYGIISISISIILIITYFILKKYQEKRSIT